MLQLMREGYGQCRVKQRAQGLSPGSLSLTKVSKLPRNQIQCHDSLRLRSYIHSTS